MPVIDENTQSVPAVDQLQNGVTVQWNDPRHSKQGLLSPVRCLEMAVVADAGTDDRCSHTFKNSSKLKDKQLNCKLSLPR